VAVADGRIKILAVGAAVAVVIVIALVVVAAGGITPMVTVITGVVAIGTITTAEANSIKGINHPLYPLPFFH
jgi:hypothetical protein